MLRRSAHITFVQKRGAALDAAKTPKLKGTKKMASDRQNLQDAFLNHVRKNKIPVTTFLVNGVKLQGVITWFDNFCVLLRRDGHASFPLRKVRYHTNYTNGDEISLNRNNAAPRNSVETNHRDATVTA